MHMQPYDCCKLYLGIKMHFTSPTYDFTKYSGKVNAKPGTFNKRRDKWFFVKLAKQYAEEDMLDLIVSNFLANDSAYIATLLNAEAKDIMLEYKRKKQALTYIFSSEIDSLFSKVEFPDDLLRVTKGANPLLLKSVYAKEISLETFVILNELLGFFDMFSEKISDTFLWPAFRLKCDKYKSFLTFNKKKFEGILKEKLHEHSTNTAVGN